MIVRGSTWPVTVSEVCKVINWIDLDRERKYLKCNITSPFLVSSFFLLNFLRLVTILLLLVRRLNLLSHPPAESFLLDSLLFPKVLTFVVPVSGTPFSSWPNSTTPSWSHRFRIFHPYTVRSSSTLSRRSYTILPTPEKIYFNLL